MNTRGMKEEKEWVIRGFSEEITKKINSKLMNDQFSYWFRYRSISWYRKRRIKGSSPINTILLALKELGIKGEVTKEKVDTHTSFYWIIEPM